MTFLNGVFYILTFTCLKTIQKFDHLK